MSPVVDVFTAADAARAAGLVAENARLRADLARAREALTAYDARLDLLQRANEARESLGFQPREVVA